MAPDFSGAVRLGVPYLFNEPKDLRRRNSIRKAADVSPGDMYYWSLGDSRAGGERLEDARCY
jgi:hypothetical protein